MKISAPSNLNRMPGEVPALPIAPHTQEPPTMNTPSPAHIAAALRMLYLYLCARRLDTATAVARAGAALSTADLTAGRVASLESESAADMHALSLADILRNLIAYGPGAHPVAALESTAHFHARNISSSDEMYAHHTTQEQLHRELAQLVRGALSEPADTSDMCGDTRVAGRAWVCTRGAHADGLHVEHRRDGAPVAIWESESAEGSK